VKAEDGIRFLRQFQELLAEGGFVTTYKFALLQALADLSVERSNEELPDRSLRLTIESIAEKFIEYYWNQVKPFRKRPHLSQSTSREAVVVSRIYAIRANDQTLLATFRNKHGLQYARLAGEVSRIIRDDPLKRLQHIGEKRQEFLYKWNDIKRQRHIRDWSIRLLPGIPRACREFHALLTSMIRGAWIQQIQRIGTNKKELGAQANLEQFLFGVDRRSLADYRQILHHHQAGNCFYCGRKVGLEGELDHFIPWSRYPLDLGHNFVFAHASCNNAKRDYLAAPIHIERWRVQNLDEGHRLARRFDEAGLLNDLERSTLIARWAYQQGQASKAQLWVRKGEFEDCDYRWQAALDSPGGLRMAAVKNPPPYQ